MTDKPGGLYELVERAEAALLVKGLQKQADQCAAWRNALLSERGVNRAYVRLVCGEWIGRRGVEI